jgi:signal-transduction protein with cAMP-binding, CBS, and nucleotidyltransferase domain
MKEYSNISDDSFNQLEKFLSVKDVKKGEVLQDIYSPAKYIYFICKGILRTYYLSIDGAVYNKNLFSENYFSASKVSLLTKEDSYLCIEALEDTKVVFIEYTGYRNLIDTNNEFKTFYINYLEKNWIIIKEKNEISLIIDDATTRYKNFILKNKNIENRIALHHIANHLGITPTQLSRIRTKLKNQHM